MAADRLSGLHFVNNRELYLTHAPKVRSLEELLPEWDFLVTDTLFDFALGTEYHIDEGGVDLDGPTLGLMLRQSEFVLLEAHDGLLLFGQSDSGLCKSAEIAPKPDSAWVGMTVGVCTRPRLTVGVALAARPRWAR